jgi:dCMP deaminase
MSEGKDFSNYAPPSWDVWFMKQAYLVAEKSKDPSTKIGAVIVKDNHIISSGFNGFPIGVNDLPERYSDRQIKYKYVVHAEANSVLSAARFGTSTLGTILYTQAIPCHDCAKCIIQGGIRKIVVHTKWPHMSHSTWVESMTISGIMLTESGVQISYLDESLNSIAYLNGKTYLI